MSEEPLSYERAGVSIATADRAKRQMAERLESADARVLNRLGAFASLFDGQFPELRNPVLVLKMEEPGSKQLLALRHGAIRGICYDLVNHLVNDVVVMGARPLAMLDTIICGKLEQEVVVQLVEHMAAACREQGCSLVGGETSEQPGVLAPGTYVLSAALLGVVDREAVIDGSRIGQGDVVLALASNGLHTNGYTLVRRLLELNPDLAGQPVGDETLLQAVLRPHLCYYQGLLRIFDLPGLHGLAHITGGGIAGNLNRILPPSTAAVIDLGAIRIPPVFGVIRAAGRVADAEMLRTFNMGVGLTAVVAPDTVEPACERLAAAGYEAYPIGTIGAGAQTVDFQGSLGW